MEKKNTSILLPKPFCFNKSKIKAFVLGADPTNFSKDNKRVDLQYAFGIGQNPNYFRVILQNLNEVGLHLEDIYIQNLLPEYQKKETGENAMFIPNASENAIIIAQEFNKIDPSKNIPVFVTAYDVYKAVLNENVKQNKPAEFYQLQAEIPISPDLNKFNRPIIPLFRHDKYRYAKWPEFKKQVKKSFDA